MHAQSIGDRSAHEIQQIDIIDLTIISLYLLAIKFVIITTLSRFIDIYANIYNIPFAFIPSLIQTQYIASLCSLAVSRVC